MQLSAFPTVHFQEFASHSGWCMWRCGDADLAKYHYLSSLPVLMESTHGAMSVRTSNSALSLSTQLFSCVARQFIHMDNLESAILNTIASQTTPTDST